MDAPQGGTPSTPTAKSESGSSMKRCPYCGAKNKASFEYCVRCSEPLDEYAPEGHIAQGRAVLSKLLVGAVVGIAALTMLAILTSLVGREAPAPTAGGSSANTPMVTPAVPVEPPILETDSEEILEDFNAGLQAFNAGDYETAASHFEIVSRELPNNPAAFQYLGLSYFHIEDFGDALDALETARSLRPDSFELLRQYVAAAKNGNEPELAVEALQEFSNAHPDNRAAKLELARLSRSMGNTDDALLEAEALAAAAEGDPELSYEYGVTLKEAGRYDEAKEILRRTIELDPDSPVAYHALGVTELLSGQPGRAIEPLETAVAKEPSNGEFRFSLAQAYEEADRVPESLAAYEEYLKHASPEDPRAEVIRERLEIARKALAERESPTQGDSGL